MNHAGSQTVWAENWWAVFIKTHLSKCTVHVLLLSNEKSVTLETFGKWQVTNNIYSIRFQNMIMSILITTVVPWLCEVFGIRSSVFLHKLLPVTQSVEGEALVFSRNVKTASVPSYTGTIALSHVTEEAENRGQRSFTYRPTSLESSDFFPSEVTADNKYTEKSVRAVTMDAQSAQCWFNDSRRLERESVLSTRQSRSLDKICSLLDLCDFYTPAVVAKQYMEVVSLHTTVTDMNYLWEL